MRKGQNGSSNHVPFPTEQLPERQNEKLSKHKYPKWFGIFNLNLWTNNYGEKKNYETNNDQLIFPIYFQFDS